MRRETAVIILLLLAALLPMWYVAAQSGEQISAVKLNTSKGSINPTERFISGPNEIGPNIAGIISWVAMFCLVGMLWYAQGFIPRIAKSGSRRQMDSSSPSDSVPVADGGANESSDGSGPPLPGFVLNPHRKLAEYHPANNGMTGLWLVAGLSLTTISFAYLLGAEGFGKARTQFIGVYAGLMFLSLAGLVMVYAAWFMPTTKVAEMREHD